MSTRDGDMSVFSDTERKYPESQLGAGFDPQMFRITPQRITTWGLNGQMAISGRWAT